VDFALTEEQRWLDESVRELLRREAGGDAHVPTDSGHRLWGALVELGALEIGPDEDALGAVELALVARAVGERLAAVPLVATAAFRYVAGPEGLEAPDHTVALCLSEPGRRFDPASPATMFKDDVVFGEKSAVLFAPRADVLAVSVAAEDGPDLALVPPDEPGVAIAPRTILDEALEAAAVQLDGACATRLLLDPAEAPLERVAAIGAVLASAEAVGAAAGILSLARGYASERRQFGKTIGSFQAIRHLLADMVVKVESSWSSVLYAAASLDEGEPNDLGTASVSKAWASRATLDVAHGALQVFGGIAFTAEHPAHRFLRRIASLGGQYGTAADHERILGQALARELEVLT
jgi:alkylation response protein AidB-like acyl-CoA dehydrogenase